MNRKALRERVIIASDRVPIGARSTMQGVMELNAEVAGTVWKVEKQAGDRVDAGDVVIIIESMKMEIPVEAAQPARVRELLVAEGDAVAEGELLARLDPA